MRPEQNFDIGYIQATGCTLRPLAIDDAELLSAHAAKADVARMTTSIPHPLTDEAVQEFLGAVLSEDRTEDVWVIERPVGDKLEFCGLISLDRMDRDQSEIGYWIAPALWGNGIASDAVAALIDANPQACRTIFGSVFKDNPASARVLSNSGFQFVGEAEAFSISRAETVPTWTYILKLD